MATRPRRTESEHVRRKQLLDAARKIFSEKGYEGATVSEIAQEAGLGKGTFYFYYPSKTTIAVALRDGLMVTMAAAVEIAMKPDTTFGEKLNTLIATSFKVARQNADLFRLAFIGADETHPEMHSESPEHAALLTTLTRLFGKATETGEMNAMDPEIAARLVLGLLQQAVIEAFVSGHGRGDESERLEQGVRQLLSNALVRQI
ncbi:MAG: TetR/AcrR family transcriptional regulator [Chloroflexi bacterium]|nr:TetR/AcrR family transcriptional regulator [Chloroflexota bacterium]